MTTEQIIALAQAGGLVVLVVSLLTGQAWAKPAVEFLQKTLTTALDLVKNLGVALEANTSTMKTELQDVRNELREMRTELKEVRDAVVQRRPQR